MALPTVSSTLSSLMGALPQSTPREPASPVRHEAVGEESPREHRATDGSRDHAATLLARATAIGSLTYGRRPAPQAVAATEATRTPIGVRGAMLDVRV